ncbi:unnamed protein product, partial [Phaeothamnion confervicola]
MDSWVTFPSSAQTGGYCSPASGFSQGCSTGGTACGAYLAEDLGYNQFWLSFSVDDAAFSDVTISVDPDFDAELVVLGGSCSDAVLSCIAGSGSYNEGTGSGTTSSKVVDLFSDSEAFVSSTLEVTFVAERSATYQIVIFALTGTGSFAASITRMQVTLQPTSLPTPLPTPVPTAAPTWTVAAGSSATCETASAIDGAADSTVVTASTVGATMSYMASNVPQDGFCQPSSGWIGDFSNCVADDYCG